MEEQSREDFRILIQTSSKYQPETKTLDHVLGHYLYPRRAIHGVVLTILSKSLDW